MESIFQNRLKQARKAKKLTQHGLSKLLDTSRSTVANWETGQSKPENTEIYYDIANVLDITVDFLLGKDNVKKGYGDNIELNELNELNEPIQKYMTEVEKLKQENLLLRAKHEAAIEYFEAIGRGQTQGSRIKDISSQTA